MTWWARAPGARGDLIEGPPPPAPGRCCAAGSSMTAPGARNPDPAGALAAACPPRPRVGCWVCLGLWLIVLVGRLCYCLPDRVRPRSASGTRAPSEDASDLCTELDPGGSVVDGLASGGVHHWRGLCRSFRVAPADLRPGTRPAHPGPAHRRRSAVALQVPGGLGGGGPGCRGPGWKIVLSLLVGHLRAAISIASHTRGRCRAWSPQWRNRPPSWCSSPGTVVRQIEPSSPGSDTGGYRPPTSSRACWRREPRRTRSGREPRARRPGSGGAGSLSAGPRPGGPWERTGGCAPCRGPRAHAPAPPRPQGRGDAPVPAGFRPRHRAQS